MTDFVVDASVAGKWVLPVERERFAIEAHEVLNAYERSEIKLLVPELFWAECANIFWKVRRRGEISGDFAARAMASLLELNIPTFPIQPLAAKALATSLQYDRAAYDCFYLALADLTGRPLLTADERLANAMGAHFPIRWLGSAGGVL